MPGRPERPEDAELRAFEPPEGAPAQPKQLLEAEEHNWRVIRDLASDVSMLDVVDDRGVYRLGDIDLVTGIHGCERYSSRGDDFTSAHGETEWTWRLSRGDWEICTVTRTMLTSDADNFYVQADLDAYEGEHRVFCRTFDATVPRDNV